MLIDRPQVTEGSVIVNATVASGASFPILPSVGELFFDTVSATLQVYSGAAWSPVGNAVTTQAQIDAITASITALSVTAATQNQIVVLTTSINDVYAAAADALLTHANNAALHLSTTQNSLLDGLAPSITSTEINHLAGVTSNIQAQLNSLAAAGPGSGSSTSFLPLTGGTLTGPLLTQSGIAAAAGLPTGGTTSAGFTFDVDTGTGLFAAGGTATSHNSIAILLNGIERFSASSSGTLVDGSQVITAANLAAVASSIGATMAMPVVVVSSIVQQAAVNTRYVLINTSAATTLTLPVSPAAGDTVVIFNRTGRLDLTIARNGNLIQGIPEDMIVDINANFEVTFISASIGWLII